MSTMIPETTEQKPKLAASELAEMQNETVEIAPPELPIESTPEQPEIIPDIPPTPAAPRTIHAVPPTPRQMDELMARVEKILEDDLGEAYNRLSPIAKQEFKVKGEQTATKIRQMMKDTTLKVKKVFKLILDWLKLLPGINRFFLEQEAKIKTDRLIELHKNR